MQFGDNRYDRLTSVSSDAKIINIERSRFYTRIFDYVATVVGRIAAHLGGEPSIHVLRVFYTT